MHAYGHEWACQLVYNLCMVPGMGLSDGEGTEQLWLRLTKLITIEQGIGNTILIVQEHEGMSV